MKAGAALKITALGALAALLLTASAWAITNPCLSISASKSGSKIKAVGTYTPNGVDCEPAGDKGVILYVNSLNGGGTRTTPTGGYTVFSGTLASETYSVFTVVPGDMSGPCGAPAICNDAVSPTVGVTM
jgi:hypothetical protein